MNLVASALRVISSVAVMLLACYEPAEVPGADDSIAWDAEAVARPEPTPAAGDAPPQSGEALYRHLPCAGCHEAAARPGIVVTPLERLSERYSVETLAAFLTAPPPPMPVFELDDAQRRKLATYLLAAHP